MNFEDKTWASSSSECFANNSLYLFFVVIVSLTSRFSSNLSLSATLYLDPSSDTMQTIGGRER